MAKKTTRQKEIAREARRLLKQPYRRELVPDESGGFAASIPELPGCVSCGEDEVEALKNLEDAALSWLEVALEDGIEIPSPRGEIQFSGRFALRMAKSLHEKISGLAEEDGVSLNQFICNVLAERVGSKKAHKRPIATEQDNIIHLKEWASSNNLGDQRLSVSINPQRQSSNAPES